jgi:hypothetical protein
MRIILFNDKKGISMIVYKVSLSYPYEGELQAEYFLDEAKAKKLLKEWEEDESLSYYDKEMYSVYVEE